MLRSHGTRIRDLLEHIQGEFRQLPGLRLTAGQAQRLWDLEATVCNALLAALVDARFLTRAPDGSFVRSRID